jgi:chromate transporter
LAGIGRVTEVGGAFLKLGMTSFGGPIAHLGYFRREFVEKRRWLDDTAYADLVALCQVLPGPTSSQVAFALGMRRAGLGGALAASLGFMLPSAAAMILFAYGVGSLGDPGSSGWLRGLRLAAVAAVALAVWGMASTLCPDWPRRIAAAAVAAFLLLVPGAPTQGGLIAGLAVLGSFLRLEPAGGVHGPSVALGRRHTWAAASLAVFAVLLLLLPMLARTSGDQRVAVFDSFYRSGALVFGGGHVVLPLLRSEVVPRGWVGAGGFMAGYGAVQAVPGPLFTFAGFLGTLIFQGTYGWCGGLLALAAIFLPGWLLIGGAAPFWQLFRGARWFQGAVRGANVAVVGILAAALCSPLASESIRGPREVVLAGAALAMLAATRVPQWAVVAMLAVAGQWLLR